MLAEPMLRGGFTLTEGDGSHSGTLEAEVDSADAREKREDIHASFQRCSGRPNGPSTRCSVLRRGGPDSG